ncbi:MAG TPA: MATE family efflux transporter [Aggregicoccus sp.]|nr:MATE family efflux transporter [Aggregicoccus sp.]
MSSPSAVAPPVSLRALFLLAWPIIVSRSTQVVIGLGDSLMVAHLGPDGLAATTTGAFNSFAVLIFPMGVVFIVSSFASQLFGAGDVDGARRYGVYGLVVAALTQLVAFVLLPALPLVLEPLSYTPEVRTLIHQYLWLRLLSVGAAVGLEALANFYGGLGNTRLPMQINVLAMVLDLAGNWMLIGGHWGAPAMGVAGAALSSTLSTVFVFLLFLGVFLWDGRSARNGGRALPRGLTLGELRRMLRFGLPSGFNWFFEFFAFNLFINTVLAGLGTTALAAFMSVLQINSVAFMPAFGLSSAGAILVGQCIGAGHKDLVPRVVRMTWASAAGWQGLVSLLYVGLPLLLLEPFANAQSKAAGLLVVGARMLRLSAAWQLFDATVSALSECLRAAGDTAFPMWSRILLAWFFFMPGAWLSVRVLGHGDLGAVAWVVLYLAALALVLWLRYRSGAWRRIQLVEPGPH